MEIPKNGNGKIKVEVKRSKNFKDSEVNILLDLVDKYKHIIENKQTDQVTQKEKERCWATVEKEFNQLSGVFFRDWKTLKNKYDNVKKTSKRKWSEEKKYVLGTGGGPSKPSMLTQTDLKIKELLGDLPVIGIESKFDSDAAGVELDIANAPVVYEEDVDGALLEHDYSMTETSTVSLDLQEPKETSSGQFIVQASPKKKFPATGPGKVEIPPPPQFDTQFSVKKLQSKTSSPLKIRKKRASPLDHTLAGRRIEVMARTKNHLFDLQKEMVQRQMEQNEEEHKKKMKLLDLKIKNEELKMEKNKAELSMFSLCNK